MPQHNSMNYIMECRSRFTESDFDFVVEVLARELSQSATLSELLTDEDSRNSIPDQRLAFATTN